LKILSPAPSTLELLEAVAVFLREQAVPALGGSTAFQARVAARMLDIVQRELRCAPAAQASELDSLRVLLGMGGGEADALRQEICRRIAAGDLDLQSPGLEAHLWQVTLDKLAVDQPDYDTYLRVCADTRG
jgi:hypothetical protein